MKRSIKNFFKDNWKLLLRCALSVIGLIVACYLVFCLARAVKIMQV